MRTSKIAVLTTIFPMDRCCLDEFLVSLASQTYKEFDLIVVNDGFGSIEHLRLKFPSLRITELISNNTPSKNRELGIKYAKDEGYEIAVFADSDDYFDLDRVEKNLELLESNPVVVNDLSLFDGNGVYEERYFLNRLSEGEVIDIEFIQDKNLFGLSNTAFRLELYSGFDFPDDLIAVDWYFFSRILEEKGCFAIFSSEVQTYYRQHPNNTVGMKALTVDSFRKGLDVKVRHYRALTGLSLSYKKMLNEMDELSKREISSNEIRAIGLCTNHPFWWENIKSY